MKLFASFIVVRQRGTSKDSKLWVSRTTTTVNVRAQIDPLRMSAVHRRNSDVPPIGVASFLTKKKCSRSEEARPLLFSLKRPSGKRKDNRLFYVRC